MANETTAGTPAKKAAPAAPPAAGPDPAPAARADVVVPGAGNPAAAAVADAVRQGELDRLKQQRDELRKLIGDAPEVTVLRAEVDALQQVAARAGISRTSRYTMSAGVAADLEVSGVAVDPATGSAYVREGDQVKVTTRGGKTSTLDMPAPSGASRVDR